MKELSVESHTDDAEAATAPPTGAMLNCSAVAKPAQVLQAANLPNEPTLRNAATSTRLSLMLIFSWIFELVQVCR